MTPRRLEWLIRIYGPAIAMWPERERLEALVLLRRSARLREALAEALVDDETLDDGDDADTLARMHDGLDEAIASRAAQDRLAQGARTTMRFGALAACAVLGVWIGADQATGQGSERDMLQMIASLSPASSLGALQP